MKPKLCAITGGRSEYGILYSLLKEIKEDDDLELQLIATAMHLSPEFGLTYREIEAEGFKIDKKIETLLSSDTSVGAGKAIGLGVIGFSEAFEELKPDLIILLGDRYEILAAAEAALMCRIPVAHICGGDITEAAFDDAIRHCITKLSHLHFVTNEASLQVVRQLGENPQHIFNVGNPAIDRILNIELLEEKRLEELLDFKLLNKNLLITFHPATLDNVSPQQQFNELLEALHSLGSEIGLLFTKPNADPEGRGLMRQLEGFVLTHNNAVAYTALGQQLYFSLVSQVDAVIGNSSSGLLEVPSFKKPTVNIGDRQKGRLQASSVINCPAARGEIEAAIKAALIKDCSNTVNPYGDGGSAKRILEAIKSIDDYRALIKKKFYRVGEL